jgi:hypothetical protein
MDEPKYTVSFTLKPEQPFTVLVLEMGGFLPLCFTNSKVIMLDRNIISNAENILSNGKHKDNIANEWWFKFINSSSFILSPALAAVEGRKQEIPSYDEFCHEFNKGRNVLMQAFPNANIIEYSDAHYHAGYELLKEVTRSYESDVDLLINVVPLIVNRNPARKLQEVEQRILSIAKDCGLFRPTFALIACLSCLYEDENSQNKSIGRQIIKPKQEYTRSMAHNALMDLVALNLLIQGNAKLNVNIGLCTSDKGLIRFWCALKVKPDGTSTAKGFNFTMEFTPEMFQTLNHNELVFLKERVLSYDF